MEIEKSLSKYILDKTRLNKTLVRKKSHNETIHRTITTYV